jgi:hypothetical protein
LVEHATENRSVGGSIPPLGTISFSLIEPVLPSSAARQRESLPVSRIGWRRSSESEKAALIGLPFILGNSLNVLVRLNASMDHRMKYPFERLERPFM